MNLNSFFRLTLLFVIALMISLTACASEPETPEEVADAWLTSVKEQNLEDMSKYYEGTVSEYDFDAGEIAITGGFSKEMRSMLAEKLRNFEYKLSDESVNEDTATLQVYVKTYSLHEAFASALTQAFQKAFESAVASAGAIQEDSTASIETVYAEKIETAPFTYEATVPLVIVKSGDGWKIAGDEQNSAFLNAVYGGLIDYMTSAGQGAGELPVQSGE